MDVFLLHLVPPSLPSFPPLQSLVAKHEKRLVALEAFQVGRLEVGTVHTKGLHPLRCRTIVLPPPTFSVPNEVLPLPSYSLTHSESERKKTHPPLLEHEIWRRQGAQGGGGGLKILEPSPSFTPRPDDHDTRYLSFGRGGVSPPVRLIVIRYHSVRTTASADPQPGKRSSCPQQSRIQI